MAKRQISDRALGMHIGYACESHVRGILNHFPLSRGWKVSRNLPFSFPVDPDVVLLDTANKVRAIFIVAYWQNSDSSHKKFHRTRLEYQKVLEARAKSPEFFASNVCIVTVIYGEADGWKELILDDLEQQCSPLLFIPNTLGDSTSRALIDDAFNVYRTLWEEGKKQVRELTEKYFSDTPLSHEARLLLKEVELILERSKNADLTQIKTLENSRFPSSPHKSRYRQALGMLSVFKENEIFNWQQKRGSLDCQECLGFARKAVFLNLAKLAERRSILNLGKSSERSVSNVAQLQLKLRQPVRKRNGNEQYAPDLPDFQDWLRLKPQIVQNILQTHRELTRQPTSVFKGGTFDQCSGNLEAISTELLSNLPQLISALKQNNIEVASTMLQQAELTTAPNWHPAYESAWMCPLWSFSVCSLAISTNNRKLRAALKARREDVPSQAEAEELAQRLAQDSESLRLLEEVIPFLTALQNSQLVQLLNYSQPKLLDLGQPCSWLSDMYNTLTTNSSHNPLNELLRCWVIKLFPDAQWHGWPNRRSINVSKITGTSIGRRQWQLIGIQDKKLIGAEVKSITQNNWGNKSKEIYDRATEFRNAGSQLGFETHCILIFDGDLTRDALTELKTGIGHDEVWTIDEVINGLSDVLEQP